MTGPLHDAERLIAPESHPGDPGRAEVVETDLLARHVVDEELLARDARSAQVVAQLLRKHALGRKRVDDEASSGFPLHQLEERKQVRLDRDAARDLRLRGLDLAVLVDRPVDVNGLAIEVDARPLKGLELTRSHERVDGDRKEPPPPEGYARAIDERRCLVRIEVALCLDAPSVRPADAVRRIVLPRAKTQLLRVLGVAEHLRHEAPHVRCGLPSELAVADTFVEILDDPLEIDPLHFGDVLPCEVWSEPLLPPSPVVVDGGEAAVLAFREPAIDPILHQLALEVSGRDANGDRVIAFGTAGFADTANLNGRVVLGSRCFVHDPPTKETSRFSTKTKGLGHQHGAAVGLLPQHRR